MSNKKVYWNSQEQLEGDENFLKQAEKEFSEYIPVEDFLGKEKLETTTTSRRDFLKFMGFSVAAATLAACETPVIKSIPYVVKPTHVTPGVPNYYASSFFDGFDFGSILVKTREGRPIFIEGNKQSKITNGAVNARINSSVLSLYDTSRFTSPKKKNGEEFTNVSWTDLDAEIEKKIEETKAKGGKIRILSNTIISPSTKNIVKTFAETHGGESGADIQHVTYDAISNSGMLNANKADFGIPAIPDYKFDKAEVIVGVNADFLNTWLISNRYASQYAKTRKPENGKMSRHFHFESNMSLTGSNADVRGAIKPSENAAVLSAIYNGIAKRTGASTIKSYSIDNDNNAVEKIESAVSELLSAKGKSLVVAGSNDTYEQHLVNAINNLLNNYGNTISWEKPFYIRQGIDQEVQQLISDLNKGTVDLLFIYGTNPAYSMPASWNFAEAIGKAGMSVSFAIAEDETSALCDFIAPDNHFLESWGDAEAQKGEYSLIQPTIRNLYKTRQVQASFLTWSGLGSNYYAYLKEFWETNILKSTVDLSTLGSAWKKVLHDGTFSTSDSIEMPAYLGDVTNVNGKLAAPASSEWEVEFYTSTSMADGRQANNPWLLELTDPMTRIGWDNYITMNPKQMEGTYNIKLAQETPAHLAVVKVNGQSIVLPVVPQPGQKIGTIGIALGWGRTKTGKAGKDIGKNAFPMLSYANGSLKSQAVVEGISATGETYPMAAIQTHHTMMGRKIVNETTLSTYQGKPKEEWNADAILKDAYGKPTPVDKLNLWGDHIIAKGHRWGLTIDLNTCIGCGSCVTACHSENNVPVVGKDEIRRTRSMSWIRIDRYYSSDADPKGHGHGVEKNYSEMEIPSEYPQTVFQPVMCQHCNHAPCETVCPVAATTHSNEGLNQMTYNRCIGTRYCANNCPYKVRRFNWFNYVGNEKFASFNPSQDSIGRMVLNPDVTVRARGVMEKCSMCVQRIQAGKLTAKKESRKIADGEIQTACASACPTSAITFGDLNAQGSAVRKEAINDRSYHLLEEVGTQPNVFYQTKVRNIKEQETTTA